MSPRELKMFLEVALSPQVKVSDVWALLVVWEMLVECVPFKATENRLSRVSREMWPLR